MHTSVRFCEAPRACLSVRKWHSTNQLIIIISGLFTSLNIIQISKSTRVTRKPVWAEQNTQNLQGGEGGGGGCQCWLAWMQDVALAKKKVFIIYGSQYKNWHKYCICSKVKHSFGAGVGHYIYIMCRFETVPSNTSFFVRSCHRCIVRCLTDHCSINEWVRLWNIFFH